MEFVLLKRFTDKKLQNKKKNIGTSINCSISSFNFCQNEQLITLGLSNGEIMQFMQKRFEKKNLLVCEEHEKETFPLKNGHKGEVKCILKQIIFDQWYIISGSSDRTIKIWDNSKKKETIVIQTLVGHGATVLDVRYNQLLGSLFSCSYDRTFRVWKQDEGRQFCHYPYFICYQVITEFYPIKKKLEKSVFMNALAVKINIVLLYLEEIVEEMSIFLNLIRLINIIINQFQKNQIMNFIDQQQFRYFVCQNRILYIQYHLTRKYKDLKKIQENEFYKQNHYIKQYKNPHKCLFTSICYNQTMQELIASDEQGRIYVINNLTDKSVDEYELYKNKILQIQLLESLSCLVVITEQFVDNQLIKRGVKKLQSSNLHKGPIIAALTIDPQKILKQVTQDPERIVTAGQDNSIRVWDAKDMGLINVLNNHQGIEISCMVYCEYSNVIVTGHVNSQLIMWNIDSNHYIVFDQKKLQLRHNDVISCICPVVITKTQGEVLETREFFFTASYDGVICFWEISERRQNHDAQNALLSPQVRNSFCLCEGKPIECIVYNSKKELLAVCGCFNEIYLLDVNDVTNFEPQHVLRGHTDIVTRIVFDQNMLISASDDLSIIVWDVVGQYQVSQIVEAFKSQIKDMLIFDEIGYLVLMSSNQIDIWDYTQKKKTFKKENEQFNCLTYSYNERLIVVGTEQAQIQQFEIQDILGTKNDDFMM